MSDRIIQSNKEELYASCIKRKMAFGTDLCGNNK